MGAQNACMLVAPTGVAAFNIGGVTIHRALCLPVEHGSSTTLLKIPCKILKQNLAVNHASYLHDFETKIIKDLM